MTTDRRDSDNVIEREVVIGNKLGLHLRAVGRFVETASKFDAEVKVRKGNKEVDGKSIIDLMTLGAGRGSTLVLRVMGDEAAAAAKSLEELIMNKFGEE